MKVLLNLVHMLSMRRARANGGKVTRTSDAITVSVMFGIIVCAALSLTACGGGGGGGPATTTASPTSPAPQTKPVFIDAEGDSTIAGIQNSGGNFANAKWITTQNSAPADLQVDLRTTFGDGVTVENHGVPGTTVCERINGTPGYAALPSVLASDPSQIVIGNWAINDASAASGESPTQFQQCYEQFIDIVRAAGKTPVLEEPNPVVGATYYPNDPKSFDALPNYVAIMRAVAQEKGVPLIAQYDAIQSLPNWQAMLTDGVHPNDALYAIKAQNEALSLTTIIKAMQ